MMGEKMSTSNFKPGDRVIYSNCNAVYEVIAEGMINDRNDARCRVCSDIMVRCPQYVGLRFMQPDGDMSE
jgi:hypothetical protein